MTWRHRHTLTALLLVIGGVLIVAFLFARPSSSPQRRTRRVSHGANSWPDRMFRLAG